MAPLAPPVYGPALQPSRSRDLFHAKLFGCSHFTKLTPSSFVYGCEKEGKKPNPIAALLEKVGDLVAGLLVEMRAPVWMHAPRSKYQPHVVQTSPPHPALVVSLSPGLGCAGAVYRSRD